MTTWWFVASPSDPPSREAPCPPKIHARWLQVPLVRVLLSRSCPFRVLHTCHALRPVRHYPHFWISTWGLRLSGTSTHLTHVLPGTHYRVLRHLQSIPDTSGCPRYPVPARGDWFCSARRITPSTGGRGRWSSVDRPDRYRRRRKTLPGSWGTHVHACPTL